MRKLLKSRGGMILAGILFAVGGALAAGAATPSSVTAMETGQWTCASMYNCGPGTFQCCKDGDGAGLYCSRACPIEVEE